MTEEKVFYLRCLEVQFHREAEVQVSYFKNISTDSQNENFRITLKYSLFKRSTLFNI